MSRFASIFGRRNPGRGGSPAARGPAGVNKLDLNSNILFHPEILYLIVSHSTTLSVKSIRLPRDSKEAILTILDLLPRTTSDTYYIYLSGSEASVRLMTSGLRIVGAMIEAGGETYLGVDAMEELGRFSGPYTVAVSRVDARIAEWRQEYSVGVRSLDEQHKRFFEILNALFESMVRGTIDEDGGKLLRGLRNYAEGHFKSEEAIMDRYNYPGLAVHKGHHDQFTRIINSYYDAYQQGGLQEPESAIELLNVSRTWLRDHILVVDKRYEEYFRKLGLRVE